MDSIKIKISVGEHKFEAEGPTELVRSQFKAFSELVRSASEPQAGLRTVGSKTPMVAHAAEDDDLSSDALTGIMLVDGRIVSLTMSGPTAAEAALLIMLGQRELRGNLSSTGQEISDGLVKSGYPPPRVYRLLAKEIKEELVATVGEGRSMRYRLTTEGLRRTKAFARALSSQEHVKEP